MPPSPPIGHRVRKGRGYTSQCLLGLVVRPLTRAAGREGSGHVVGERGGRGRRRSRDVWVPAAGARRQVRGARARAAAGARAGLSPPLPPSPVPRGARGRGAGGGRGGGVQAGTTALRPCTGRECAKRAPSGRARGVSVQKWGLLGVHAPCVCKSGASWPCTGRGCAKRRLAGHARGVRMRAGGLVALHGA